MIRYLVLLLASVLPGQVFVPTASGVLEYRLETDGYSVILHGWPIPPHVFCQECSPVVRYRGPMDLGISFTPFDGKNGKCQFQKIANVWGCYSVKKCLVRAVLKAPKNVRFKMGKAPWPNPWTSGELGGHCGGTNSVNMNAEVWDLTGPNEVLIRTAKFTIEYGCGKCRPPIGKMPRMEHGGPWR